MHIVAGTQTERSVCAADCCESTVYRGGVCEDYRDAVLFGGEVSAFRQYLLSRLVPT